MKKYFYLIVILVALVIALPAWQVGLGNMTVETMVGAFLGTVAGAMLVYTMQLRMEQTRFFQLVLSEIKDVFASKTAWQKTENGWLRCEFRKAVGMADWEEDPVGTDGKAHLRLQINLQDAEYSTIDWEGVVYRIDDQFCVASKPLHDYANWYSLVINAYESHLLNTTHIKSLWRSLVDAFIRIDKVGKQKGMQNWSEFFVFGKNMENHPGYKVHKKIMKKLSRYEPARSHTHQKNGKMI